MDPRGYSLGSNQHPRDSIRYPLGPNQCSRGSIQYPGGSIQYRRGSNQSSRGSNQSPGDPHGSSRDPIHSSGGPVWGPRTPTRPSRDPRIGARRPDRSPIGPRGSPRDEKTTSLENTHPQFAPIFRCGDQEGNHALRPPEGGDPLQKEEATINPIATSDGTGTATAIPAGTTVGKINIATQRAKVEAQFTALVNGINTLVSDPTIACGDQVLPKAQVVSRLQARINAAEATKTARLALHAAVAAEALTVTDTTPLVVDLKAYFVGKYGKTSPKLQTLGFTPAKVPQKSAAAKATSAAQAKATRAAIGPTGKKQRKAAAAAIKANAAAPAPATSPAPAAAPVTTGPVTNGGK